MPIRTREGRLPVPQINPFRSFITKELNRRRDTYPTPMFTPFARFTSCLRDEELQYEYFSVGLHGYDGPENIFNLTHGSDREVVGYAYRNGEKTFISADELSRRDLEDIFTETEAAVSADVNRTIESLQRLIDPSRIPADGAHPVPGITDIHVERYNDGAGTRARVTWNCYNQQQLEFLRHHFMTVGTNVVLEWGHMATDYQPEDLLDFSADDIAETLAECYVDRSFIIREFCEPNNGNYDLLVGEVYNFNINFDAKTNTYKCITEIVSTGEYIFGIHTTNTAIVVDRDDETTSIQEFFTEGGKYDILVNSVVGKVGPSEDYANEPLKTSVDLTQFAAGFTGKFVSWDFFATTLMQDLVTDFTRNFGDLQNQKGIQLLNFGSPENDITYKGHQWIGNNEHLLSTNPEIMLLVKDPGAHTVFGSFPRFGEGAEEPDRGLLSQGVWLNTELIREAFLKTSNVHAAVTRILKSMNTAAANYWDLRLHFDDNLNRFTVIDYKFVLQKTADYMFNDPDGEKIKFHTFNEGTSGEALEIGFESAFPASVVVQMGLMAKVTQTPNKFREFIQRMPMMGSSGYFSYAINWTNLQSTIADQIDIALTARRGQSPAIGIGSGTAADVRNADRIPEISAGARATGGATDYRGRPSPFASAVSPSANIANRENEEQSFPQNRRNDANTVTSSATELVQVPLNQLINLVRSWDPPRPGPIAAVGRYQFSLDTFHGAVQWALDNGRIPNLSVPFNGTTQEAMADYLFLSYKRPFLRNYLTGTSDNLTAAHWDIAREFAGIVSPDGTGVYDGDSGNNMARGTVEGVRSLLVTARDEYRNFGTINTLKNYVARSESGRAGYNALNRGRAGDTAFMSDEYIEVLRGVTVSVTQSPLNSPPISGPVSFREYVGLGETTATLTQPGQEQISAEESRRRAIIQKFGDWALSMVAINRTDMIRRIVTHGIEHHGSLVNGFIAPFPLTTKIDVTFPGVGGIAMYDGFFVDKLPYIYSLYGIFQATTVVETVRTAGWTTKVGGIFRFLYFDPLYGNYLRENAS